MAHAFAWLDPGYRWIVLGVFVVATVACGAVLTAQGQQLTNGAAPQGIVSYEFGWSAERTKQILDSWKSAIRPAKIQLWLDFLFLALYPPTLSLCCAMLSESRFNSMAAVGVFLSWAVLAAGPIDATENVALLRMLEHGAASTPSRIAAWCAGLKFMLVYSCLGYLALQGLAVAVNKLRGE